jgi:hypothetical protein
MAEAIINLQALLVKSYLLDALLINRKAFPIGCHGAQVLLFLAVTDIGQRCTGKRSQAENVVRSRCRRPHGCGSVRAFIAQQSKPFQP